MKVAARVYNLDMTEKFSREAKIDVAEDSSARVSPCRKSPASAPPIL